MNAGTVLVLLGTIFAFISLLPVDGRLLAVGVILIGVGILVGAPSLSLR